MTDLDRSTPDPREALRKEVAHVLMRAGYGSEAAAFDVADDIILTVQHPGLRWDIDDDHLTPEHRAALAQAEAAPDEPATDDDIERWYAAFEKVSGSEAKTFQGRAQIYWRFAAEYARLSSFEPTEGES